MRFASPTARPFRVGALVLVAGVAAVSLAGCSTVGDVVGQQLGSVACSAGAAALEQLATDVAAAVGDIAVDPAAALAALTAAEASLTVAAIGITEEPTASAIASARASLQQLISIANGAAGGKAIDQASLDTVASEFTRSVGSVC